MSGNRGSLGSAATDSDSVTPTSAQPDAVTDDDVVRLRRTICLHEVEVGNVLAGVCKWCQREVVANGCGPGWVLLSRIKDPASGWRVCRDGMARWFGKEASDG